MESGLGDDIVTGTCDGCERVAWLYPTDDGRALVCRECIERIAEEETP